MGFQFYQIRPLNLVVLLLLTFYSISENEKYIYILIFEDGLKTWSLCLFMCFVTAFNVHVYRNLYDHILQIVPYVIFTFVLFISLEAKKNYHQFKFIFLIECINWSSEIRFTLIKLIISIYSCVLYNIYHCAIFAHFSVSHLK